MELRTPLSRCLVAVSVVAAGALLAVVPTQAAITRVGTHLEVGNGTLGEIHPDVAYSDKSNAYLVVWGDGGGGTRRPAYAQLVSAAGTLVGPKLELTTCAGELYGQRPRVAYSGGSTDDVFVVVYRQWCSGAATVVAHIVRYSAGGALSVERATIRGSGVPGGIVYNAVRKEFVAVWEEFVGATAYDAQARALPLARDGSGVVTGFGTLPANIPIGALALTQGRPRIALDPGSQTYLVAFQGENPSTGANALMYRTMDASTFALSPLMYAAQGGYNVEASVVYLPTPDEFLVTWRQGLDVVGRRFAPGSGAPTSSTYPLIARPGTDGATGAAYDLQTSTGMVAGMNADYYVWASEFASNGALLSTFQASGAAPTPPGGGTFFPQVAATGDGGLGMTYGTDYKRVYLDRFTASGGGPPPPPPSQCTISLSASSASASPAGSGGTFGLTVSAAPCSWTASSNAAWLTVSPGSGTTSTTLNWTAQANNTSSQRTGIITAGGQQFTVTQGIPGGSTLQFDGSGGGDLLAYVPTTGAYEFHLGSSNGLAPGLSGTWLTGWQIQSARFNGDDLTDFFYYNPSSGEWRKGINTGGNLTIYGGTWNTGWEPTVVDLDGDGVSDVFVYNPSSGAWRQCLSNAVDSFACTVGTPTWAPGWKVFPAKFNGDVYGDLFLYNTSASLGGLWFKVLGQSNGTFTYVAGDIRWAPDWQITPADFDGDGVTDLLLYRTSDGMVFRVKFTATSATYMGAVWGRTWTMRKGDFNGDRRADLLLYDPESVDGRWAVGLGNASNWFDFYYPSVGAGLGWTPYVGSIDGDNKSDAVWYHADTGATVVWFATTAGAFSYVVGPTLPEDAVLLLTPVSLP